MPTISFRCPGCQARIKAPARLLGQQRPCPCCGRRLAVRLQAPRDEGPTLVTDDAWGEATPGLRPAAFAARRYSA
jgi:hypothetical protein